MSAGLSSVLLCNSSLVFCPKNGNSGRVHLGHIQLCGVVDLIVS